jgi:hypothetical protein
VTHIPDPGQVLTRYYGWYANRTRGRRRRALGADAAPSVAVVEPVALPLREARRRWAELLRRIFEVDPLACPRCGRAMRIVAFLTAPTVIDRILTHLRTRAPAAPARAPPSLTRRARTGGTAQRA